MRPRLRLPGGNGLPLIALVLATVGVIAGAGSQLEHSPGPGRPAAAQPAVGETLTLGWSAAPTSFDPAYAADPTAANLVWNLFEPLVRLGPDLAPVPAAAEAWERSRNGRRFTFRLRDGARWTNGGAVTARDYVYAWRRVLDPARESPLAERLFAIEGAGAYHRCAGDECGALGRRVGIRARDARTLVVDLVARAPWFPAETAHPAFLPVHSSTVERLGEGWTDPESIVTNGPFALESATDDAVLLVKNRTYHAARLVSLGRVVGRVIPDGVTRVQAFDAGEVMALDGGALPAADLPALRERQEYETYPALGAYLYAFNLRSVRDVHQRRAMALAIDRDGILANVVQADMLPATRFTPTAVPGFEQAAESPWLPEGGDLSEARRELRAAAAVEETITLLHVDSPGDRAIALAVREAWRELGIETTLRAHSADEYLSGGPLPSDFVDVYQLELRYPTADAFAGVAVWACNSDRNRTSFCRKRFDALVAEARREVDPAARQSLYAEAEQILSGPTGSLPAAPVFWHAHANLEALSVRDTFAVNPLGQIDLGPVRVR